ncbi:MAG TPA: C4-dicarboxylate transporter DctA [Rickettsiales bacterium]|nr:C4-dicarboxylate transporter DctA [Rickettsiales bacterium]
MKKPFYKDLFLQVIAAIILGVIFGYVNPAAASKMKPLGDAFINLIKMMIAPIIFCTIVSGVAGMGSMKQVGRVGVKALLCFEVITTFALVIGLILVKILHPGADLNIDVSKVDTTVVKSIGHVEEASTVDFLMHIIPSTLVGAFSNGEILQVLLVAILFAMALPALGERGKEMLNFLDLFSHILFKMVDIITKLAPLGAFGAMAFTVGRFGIGSLKDLGELVAIFYVTCGLFIIIAMWPLMRFYCRLSTWQFLKFIREEIFIVLGTSSSESVLPRIMEKLEILGCSRPVVGMVVPTGYSFNLVGSSIYFTMGALFIAYATHTQITLWQELTLLGVLLIASKGAAGVTGSAFIVLAATLGSMKIMPQQNLDIGLALIFAVDRFMSTGRAITNLIGNGITTIVVAKWENALKHEQAERLLREGCPDI